jgi:hypothetical protein
LFKLDLCLSFGDFHVSSKVFKLAFIFKLDIPLIISLLPGLLYIPIKGLKIIGLSLIEHGLEPLKPLTFLFQNKGDLILQPKAVIPPHQIRNLINIS